MAKGGHCHDGRPERSGCVSGTHGKGGSGRTLPSPAAYSHRVGTLVLGAFGCGVFGNDPERVANATCDMIEKYGKYFRHIEVPVYCGRNVTGRTNYDVFAEVFAGRFGKDVIENADVPKNRTQRTGREDRGRGGR